MRNLQTLQLLAYALQVCLRGLQKLRVAGAELDRAFPHQPPRKTAELPLCARIRSGTKDHPQSFLLRDAAELRHVLLSAEVVFPRLHFVVIPEHVRADGIKSHSLAHLDAMTPVRARHTRKVHFAATYLHNLAIEDKRIFLQGHLKRVLGLRHCHASQQHTHSSYFPFHRISTFCGVIWTTASAATSCPPAMSSPSAAAGLSHPSQFQ